MENVCRSRERVTTAAMTLGLTRVNTGNGAMNDRLSQALASNAAIRTARESLAAELAKLQAGESSPMELAEVALDLGVRIGSLVTAIVTADATARAMLNTPQLFQAGPRGGAQTVTLAMPDVLKVQLMPSAPSPGVVVDYDSKGRIRGTRPRPPGQTAVNEGKS